MRRLLLAVTTACLAVSVAATSAWQGVVTVNQNAPKITVTGAPNGPVDIYLSEIPNGRPFRLGSLTAGVLPNYTSIPGINPARMSGKPISSLNVRCQVQQAIYLFPTDIGAPTVSTTGCETERRDGLGIWGKDLNVPYYQPTHIRGRSLSSFVKSPLGIGTIAGGAGLATWLLLRDGDDGTNPGGGNNLPLSDFYGNYASSFTANGGCGSFSSTIMVAGVNASVTASFFDVITWNLSGTGSISGNRLDMNLSGTNNFGGVNVPTTLVGSITGKTLTATVGRNFGGGTNCQQPVTGTRP